MGKIFLIRYACSTLLAMLLSVLSLFLVFSLSTRSINFVDFQPEVTKFLIIAFPGALIFIAVYFGFFSYRHYSIVQVAKISDERTQLRLRFEALRNQLSPHYLFNSLNTISSLVYKDAKLAEEFVRRLASSFRYIIGTDQKRLVRLEEEINFIRSYHHLLKVRFETAINLNIDVSDTLDDHLIPPLTLQILIENAVKHNQFDNKNRLDIQVYAKEDSVIVTNNKKESDLSPTSMKVGLENIKSRYTFFSERKIQIEDLPEEYTVTVPLLAPTDINE